MRCNAECSSLRCRSCCHLDTQVHMRTNCNTTTEHQHRSHLLAMVAKHCCAETRANLWGHISEALDCFSRYPSLRVISYCSCLPTYTVSAPWSMSLIKRPHLLYSYPSSDIPLQASCAAGTLLQHCQTVTSPTAHVTNILQSVLPVEAVYGRLVTSNRSIQLASASLLFRN